jgi:hypothetical protein
MNYTAQSQRGSSDLYPAFTESGVDSDLNDAVKAFLAKGLAHLDNPEKGGGP